MAAWSLLFASRKFWIGTLSITATLGAVFLRAIDKLPADALLPTIAAITTTGLGVIGSIAWEDSAAKGAGGQDAPPPAPLMKGTTQINVGAQAPNAPSIIESDQS